MLIKNLQIKKVWRFIATSILLAGCSVGDDVINPAGKLDNAYIISPSEIIEDNLAKRFGTMLAASMKMPEVRDFLKEEAIKKFDGDYNILFAEAKNKSLNVKTKNGRIKSLTFGEILLGTALNGKTMNGSEQLLDSLQELYPVLQISVPELPTKSAENWDIENHEPLVAILNSNFDDATAKYIKAYNSEGKLYEVSATNQPDELVVVVGPSERVIAIRKDEDSEASNGKVQKCASIMFEDDIYNYYDRSSYTDCMIDESFGGGSDNGGSSGDGGSEDFNSCRSYAKYEWLYQINCTNLSSYESWARGAPELRIKVMSPQFSFSSLIHSGELKPKKRKDRQ